MQVCFSAILPSCTARKNKHHTYFADNTPLPNGMKMPEYENALNLFLNKVRSNLLIIENLYAFIERDNRVSRTELAKAKFMKLNVTDLTPQMYGIEPNTAGAIITSPPYLCMADYTRGLRLSYHWFTDFSMQEDYENELGARRHRFKPKTVVDDYITGLEKFVINAAKLIKPEGFLALVFGQPTASAFSDINFIAKLDDILKKHKFTHIWENYRELHHRRGFGCMEKERISVHILD